jgi:hypothetical protein
MSLRNSYSIPILNELHELYPDILYRPSQFQTSDDVIQYILDRGVHNRFRQESERYRARMQRQNIPIIINPIRHRPLVEQIDVELYNDIPSISSILPPIMSNSSSIEQLFSFFLRESGVADNSSTVIRPTEEQLNRNTTVSAIVDDNNTACAICQDTLTNGQMARCLHHCSHIFHQSCVDTWFETHATCPTCRHDIRLG